MRPDLARRAEPSAAIAQIRSVPPAPRAFFVYRMSPWTAGAEGAADSGAAAGLAEGDAAGAATDGATPGGAPGCTSRRRRGPATHGPDGRRRDRGQNERPAAPASPHRHLETLSALCVAQIDQERPHIPETPTAAIQFDQRHDRGCERGVRLARLARLRIGERRRARTTERSLASGDLRFVGDDRDALPGDQLTDDAVVGPGKLDDDRSHVAMIGPCAVRHAGWPEHRLAGRDPRRAHRRRRPSRRPR